MNIHEIAKRARVSAATVSRALNQVSSVEPKLARRVWRVAREYGYFPNTQARSLVSGKSKILGVVTPEILDPFFASIVESFERLAAKNGYEMLLATTGYDVERSRAAVRCMIQRRVDGIAHLTSQFASEWVQNCTVHGVPVACIDIDEPLSSKKNVRVDYLDGIRQAVDHLAALRHRRIAFIDDSNHPTAGGKREMFQECMKAIMLPVSPKFIVTRDPGENSIERALSYLIQLVPRPSAVICFNDLFAIGLLQEAMRKGIVVPKDLSVVGIEDIWLAEATIPALTTVRVPQDKIAGALFGTLQEQWDPRADNLYGDRTALPTKLIVRDSTSLAPNENLRKR